MVLRYIETMTTTLACSSRGVDRDAVMTSRRSGRCNTVGGQTVEQCFHRWIDGHAVQLPQHRIEVGRLDLLQLVVLDVFRVIGPVFRPHNVQTSAQTRNLRKKFAFNQQLLSVYCGCDHNKRCVWSEHLHSSIYSRAILYIGGVTLICA